MAGIEFSFIEFGRELTRRDETIAAGEEFQYSFDAGFFDFVDYENERVVVV